MIITSRNGKEKLKFLESGVEGVYVLDHVAFLGKFNDDGNDWDKSAGKLKLKKWANENLQDAILAQFDIDLPTLEEVFSQKMLNIYASSRELKSKQFPIFQNSDNRMMSFGGMSERWWTRSAFDGTELSMWHVDSDGNIGDSDARETLGFVPVLRKKRINEEAECWGRLVNVATEYAQKHMHPHKTIIITQQGIELLEGDKAAPIEVLD